MPSTSARRAAVALPEEGAGDRIGAADLGAGSPGHGGPEVGPVLLEAPGQKIVAVHRSSTSFAGIRHTSDEQRSADVTPPQRRSLP